jgi:ATP-binding cassette subfamily B protein
MTDRTTIIIGHRISSVKAADQIVVMEEGEIVERGTHDTLLERNGIYADMYHKQLLDEAAERHEFIEAQSPGTGAESKGIPGGKVG